MKAKSLVLLAGVVLYAVTAGAAIHETWQIDISGILNGENEGQITINGVGYDDGPYAPYSYRDGLNILGLAYYGTFTGTVTLEVQYKESEYTPGEYEMDKSEFGIDGWLVTGAEMRLPTSLGGIRTFTVDFTTASHDSYRSLEWYNDVGECTTDFPNGHPEISEKLHHAFPAYGGPGNDTDYNNCSYMAFVSQYSTSNVWAGLNWYEDVDGSEGADAIFVSMHNITMTPHQVIPEPATLALLTLGGAALISRRKK